jgi:hypothetical protein
MSDSEAVRLASAEAAIWFEKAVELARENGMLKERVANLTVENERLKKEAARE